MFFSYRTVECSGTLSVQEKNALRMWNMNYLYNRCSWNVSYNFDWSWHDFLWSTFPWYKWWLCMRDGGGFQWEITTENRFSSFDLFSPFQPVHNLRSTGHGRVLSQFFPSHDFHGSFGSIALPQGLNNHSQSYPVPSRLFSIVFVPFEYSQCFQ